MRVLEVLKESKSDKPLGVLLKDGSIAGPGKKVPEVALMGGVEAADRLLAETPLRVREVKGKSKKQVKNG